MEESNPRAQAIRQRLHALFSSEDGTLPRNAIALLEELHRELDAASRSRTEPTEVDELLATIATPLRAGASELSQLTLQVIVTTWSLGAGEIPGKAYRAASDETWDLDRALERIASEFPTRITADEDELELRLWLLEHAGRAENRARVPVWETVTKGEVLAATKPEVCRQLARRRVMFAAERLTRLADSLEATLLEAGVFAQLDDDEATTPALLHHQLQSYGYLERAPFWRGLQRSSARVARTLLRVTAGERIAYEWTQGAGRLVAQWVLIAITATVAQVVLFGLTQWHAHQRSGLTEDRRHVEARLQEAASEVEGAVVSATAAMERARSQP